jgi:hypothetical protein
MELVCWGGAISKIPSYATAFSIRNAMYLLIMVPSGIPNSEAVVHE